jgi:hypothetical protein
MSIDWMNHLGGQGGTNFRATVCIGIVKVRLRGSQTIKPG